MICRRCGMESSTTDTCEWCKKPMLPPGGSISARAKEQILREKEAPPPPPAESAAPTVRAEETPDEAVVRRPESKPPPPLTSTIEGLSVLGGHLTEEGDEPQAAVLSTVEQTTNESLLVPLGANVTGPADQGQDRTIYVGNEEDVVRPIERPAKDGSRWVMDASGRRRRVLDTTPEVSDKQRLLRAAVGGGVVAFVMAFVQFAVHRLPEQLISEQLKITEGFAGAVQYGVYSAVLLGFMLAALLVQWKKGPFVGLLLGLGLGWGITQSAAQAFLPLTLTTGGLCGAVVGYFSVKGLKRVVTV